MSVNTLRPRQNGPLFTDDIFKCICVNRNIWISIEISLKSAPKGSINDIPALVQIMAWRRPGGKPLSEPMMISLLKHMRHSASMSISVSNHRKTTHYSTLLALYKGNPSVTGGFTSQRASNSERVSMSGHDHDHLSTCVSQLFPWENQDVSYVETLWARLITFFVSLWTSYVWFVRQFDMTTGLHANIWYLDG